MFKDNKAESKDTGSDSFGVIQVIVLLILSFYFGSHYDIEIEKEILFLNIQKDDKSDNEKYLKKKNLEMKENLEDKEREVEDAESDAKVHKAEKEAEKAKRERAEDKEKFLKKTIGGVKRRLEPLCQKQTDVDMKAECDNIVYDLSGE